MKAKRFLIYTVLYLIIVALIIVFFFSDLFTSIKTLSFSFLEFKYDLELSSLVWVCLPILVYAVFANLYFYYALLTTHFAKKRLLKDSQKFEGFLEELVLDKKESYNFKTKEFQDARDLVRQLYYEQAGSVADKLNNALAIKAMILNKEVCDLKLFRLSKDNYLYIQNEINKVSSDINQASIYLKNKTELNDEISLAAYNNLINNADYVNIKMLKIQKSKDDVMCIINRFENKDLSLSNAEFEVLIFSVEFSEEEYLYIAKHIINSIEALSLKAIFEKLKNQNEEALRAYLYILAKLALYDELLEEMHTNEGKLEDFELLIFLKEQGKKYDVDKLIC